MVLKTKMNLTKDDNCVVCFTDFMDDTQDNILSCTKCNGVVHKDCFKIWCDNAVRPGCCYCKDQAILINVH